VITKLLKKLKAFEVLYLRRQVAKLETLLDEKRIELVRARRENAWLRARFSNKALTKKVEELEEKLRNRPVRRVSVSTTRSRSRSSEDVYPNEFVGGY
jgi:hypothetical protein